MEQRGLKMKNEDRYMVELKKCLKKECVVKDIHNIEHTGICLGINFTHLNVVLMSDTHKIIIKNIVTITRKRRE